MSILDPSLVELKKYMYKASVSWALKAGESPDKIWEIVDKVISTPINPVAVSIYIHNKMQKEYRVFSKTDPNPRTLYNQFSNTVDKYANDAPKKDEYLIEEIKLNDYRQMIKNRKERYRPLENKKFCCDLTEVTIKGIPKPKEDFYYEKEANRYQFHRERRNSYIYRNS